MYISKMVEIRTNLIAVYNKYMERKIDTDATKALNLFKFAELVEKDEKFEPFLDVAEELEGFLEATERFEDSEKEAILSELAEELRKIMKEV